MPTAAGRPTWATAMTPPPRNKAVNATPGPMSPPCRRAGSVPGKASSAARDRFSQRPSPPGGYPVRRAGPVELYKQHEQQRKSQDFQSFLTTGRGKRPSSCSSTMRRRRNGYGESDCSFTSDHSGAYGEYMNDSQIREDSYVDEASMGTPPPAWLEQEHRHLHAFEMELLRQQEPTVLEKENYDMRAYIEHLQTQVDLVKERGSQYQNEAEAWREGRGSALQDRREYFAHSTEDKAYTFQAPKTRLTAQKASPKTRLNLFRQAADGRDGSSFAGDSNWNR